MKNRKEIMTEAHNFAKDMEGNYIARLSEGLKMAWILAKKDAEMAKADVKSLYNLIRGGYVRHSHYSSYWSMDAQALLETVANKSKGFQSDVAKKALEFGRVSEKQAWVLAYEFKNVA